MLRLGRERDLLKIVDDQIGAPTSAEAITDATLAALSKLEDRGESASGLYHLTCAGETSWYGFARAIFAQFAARQQAPEVLPIPTDAYPMPAKRPKNSRLNCEKFAVEFGYRMPPWESALGDVAATMLAGDSFRG
jgi:dTDP-4-dehydrorhamnose reductase